MNLSSGYPYWLIKDGLPFEYPKLESDLKGDIIVLGGGISGALTAWYLADAGFNVTVIDARTIGLGSTCASTSLLQYEIDTPLSELIQKIGHKPAVRAYKLCEQSIHELSSLAKKIGFKNFTYKQSLYYTKRSGDLGFIEEEYIARKDAGFKVSCLESADIEKKFGFSAKAGILSEIAADTDAYAFTHALHQASIKRGMKIYDRTRVEKITHHKSGVKLITDTGYTITAKKLIYATGYEAVNYIREKIVDLDSTYACCSEQYNDKTEFLNEDVLIWNTDDPYLYLRTTADRRVIVGGRDESFYNPAKRDKLIRKKTRALTRDVQNIYPHLDFKPEFSWTGTFGSTKDGLPYIGPYHRLPNSYFALGFGGNGITFSLIAAQIITDLLLSKKNPDTAIFSFDR